MNTIRHNPSRRTPRTRGFTLIELMIAMILGLIVIAGVTSVFLAGEKSFRTNNALGEVEDSSRIAFELMARDIREAGQTGCDSTNAQFANLLNNRTTDWWANWGNAVHGYDDNVVDPGVAIGTGVGQRVANTDSLQLIGGGLDPVATQGTPGTAEDSYTLNPGTTPASLATGDLVVVCSPSNVAIMQISAFDASNPAAPTMAHAGGGSTPGNCLGGVWYPINCTASGEDYVFPMNSLVSRLNATDWYIGNNPAGGQSLYRIALVNNAGAVSAQAQEMVRNVTNMQVTYLQAGSPAFVDATAVTNWGLVNAARVTLTIQSTFQRASVNGNQPVVRTYSATTTVRNRVD